MRKATAAISTVNIKGSVFFRLTYPTAGGRKREHFSDEKKAKDRLKEIQGDAKRYGTEAAGISPALRADAVAASKELAGTSKTLLDAARFLREHITRTEGGVPIKDASTAFLASRESSSDGHQANLKPRQEYICNLFEGRTTASITTEDCQRLLDGLMCSPQTKKHYRVQLSVFFRFCMGRKWCSENPAELTTEIKVVSKEAEILSPSDAASLLAHCPDEILPGVVLQLFCGLRNAEVEKIKWEAVDLTQGIVTIGAGIAKTNSRRVVTIPENAGAWLASCDESKRKGPVWPGETKARDLWTLARINSGFGPFQVTSRAVKDALDGREDLRPWPKNALRHSAISYRIATDRDLAKIAYESGNSPAVVQRHYNGLAAPDSAKLFYSTRPTEAGNISRFVQKEAA
jgi:integrase